MGRGKKKEELESLKIRSLEALLWDSDLWGVSTSQLAFSEVAVWCSSNYKCWKNSNWFVCCFGKNALPRCHSQESQADSEQQGVRPFSLLYPCSLSLVPRSWQCRNMVSRILALVSQSRVRRVKLRDGNLITSTSSTLHFQTHLLINHGHPFLYLMPTCFPASFAHMLSCLCGPATRILQSKIPCPHNPCSIFRV